ncbi:MAG: ATPase subunit of ABC transporter with duplicated ATPase domains [Pseudoalteromonas tetraodonis]|jgi:ATPase subunit of ABC transporter with duplicated ATPase domains
MLTTSNLTIQFSGKPLFENVSVKFGDGNRYGLIGANGCGKSTLMKIMGGDLEPTHGNVSKGPDERLGMLRQDQFAFEEFSVLDAVIQGHGELWAVKQERDRIYSMTDMSEADAMKVAELEMEFAELDGYTAEPRAGELLLGVGIPTDQHAGPMSEIAPGFKLRVLLAQALFSDPDILLLDEPTNNLDINTIRWLENVLNERNCTMIIISHDRHFLNSVCTHMADLDYGELRVFSGNYDDYMLASTQAKARLQASNQRAKDKISELQAFVERFKANAARSRQTTSRLKQIDKLQIQDVKPSSRRNPYIIFEQDKKLHRQAVEVEELSVGYDGTNLFEKFKLWLEAGEKIAVIGPNGIGKTTLLKALIGDLKPTAGTIKWAENASIGYFAQDHSEMFESKTTLFDWMGGYGQPGDDDQIIRGTLGRLLFGGDDIKKPVDVLSGGEQGRMLYGKLILAKNNVLIMDEPTNHMDMESIESLQLALEKFEGTLVFVSHDREFVSQLATRIIEITETGIVEFVGNYDEYLVSQGL